MSDRLRPTGAKPKPRLRLKLAKWSIFVLLQGASAAFFFGDVSTDIYYGGLWSHTVLEGMATIALILGTVLGCFEVIRVSRIASEANTDLTRARAEFSELIRLHFSRWSLTSAEADIALLLLKGFDIAEIADFRQTARGTVRAQLSHIYEKSGHQSRGSFVSSFLDVLLVEPTDPSRLEGTARAKSLEAGRAVS